MSKRKRITKYPRGSRKFKRVSLADRAKVYIDSGNPAATSSDKDTSRARCLIPAHECSFVFWVERISTRISRLVTQLRDNDST